MKPTITALAQLLPVLLLAGCASRHGDGDRPTDNIVKIELRLVEQRCTPSVDPESITATEKRPVVRWIITDNCTQSDDESETQLMFQYQEQTPNKWLDPRHSFARTTRNKRSGRIVHVAAKRGQQYDAYADYVIYYNGAKIGDPKVVWGR